MNHVPFVEQNMNSQENHQESGEKSGKLITDPPFYCPEFEASYRYIIDTYDVEPRKIAIFIPCAVRKPYSKSPSHHFIRSVISKVFEPSQYHIVVFGTCGILPAELETMYPYAHYHYMLGKVQDTKIKEDFVRIETDRIAGYLEKTRDTYQFRVAYCIGLFRASMISGSEKAGIPIDLLLPTRNLIDRIIEEEDCAFQEGSLSMDEYLKEFYQGLLSVREQINLK
jgi:predicted RNA-binding protein